MGRAPCCDKENVKRGPWSPEEDAKLKGFIDKYGTGGNWIALPHKAGLKRCGKSCRLRWLNYLRPNIKHGEFTDDEDRIICSLYASIGSRWSIIAAQLPGRTDNDIKNYWNTKLKKKLLAMLPSFHKKPSFFPSIPLQSPPPQYRSDHFFTSNSSPFYGYNTPTKFMNMNINTNINSLLLTPTPLVQDHVNITQIPPPITHDNENSVYLGFDNTPMDYHYPTSHVKEGMSTTSSEGGSCISYEVQKQLQQQIKQEEQVSLVGFGDQGQSFFINHNYSDQKQKVFDNYERSLHSGLEEVKQLIGNTNNSRSCSSSYWFDNDDDEYKTITHDNKEICYDY